ncbi:MAG: AMP-binding protein [Clostridia bacterium]|nr:AMP-binding protein [Clostridia bacterium]
MKKAPVRDIPKITSFKDIVLAMAERDKTAYILPKGKELINLSYKDFYTMTLRLAKGITAVGLAGKRVAVIGETSPEWVATYLAVVVTGGVIVPMDKELAIGEIEGFLASVEAEAIVYSAHFNGKFDAAMAEHPSLRLFVPMAPAEGTEGEKILPLTALLEKGDALEDFTLPERDPNAMSTMLFTSGTTGTSKCVMLCERNIISSVNAALASVDFSGVDTTVSVLPLHHTYELTIMMCKLALGMTVGINDSLRHIMRNFANIQPTGLILVPLFVNTMYKKIWDEAKKKKKDKLLRRMIPVSNGLRKVGIDLRRTFFKSVLAAFGGKLTKIICGGAALNPEMVKGFEAFGIQICEGYGITECSPLIAVTPYWAPKRGSVGPAVPGCTARIASQGKNDKGFDEGEIQVKGDNVMLGYYNNDAANADAFTEDGWYRTGDIGYMDNDGYIFITGRMKSVIVLENGKNVFPEEIEEYLENMEGVAECVVVGRKGEDGETVNLTALIYPNKDAFPEDADRETIYNTLYQRITELNRKLPSFKKIKGLELRDEEFEKTTSRKIKRHLVK